MNKALEASKKAKEIFVEIKNRRFQIIAELNIGLVYNELNDYSTAISWCFSAYKTAAELKIPPLKRDACDCLYKSNKSIGKDKDALIYFEIYKNLNDSIKNIDNERSMVEKELNFNYEKGYYCKDCEWEKKLEKFQGEKA